MPKFDNILNGVKMIREKNDSFSDNPDNIDVKDIDFKKLKYDNKFKRKVITIFVVSVIVICTVTFMVCKVDNYTFNVCLYYEPEDIVNTSNIELGDSLIFLDAQTVAENLFYQFPYLDEIEINKVYPSTVEFVLTEAEEYYSVFYKTDYVIVSKSGKLIGVSDTVAEGTTLIIGGDITDINGYMCFNDEYTNQIYKDITLILTARDENLLTEIDITDIDNVEIVYDGRITILLGDGDNISYKLRSAFQIIDSGEIKETESGTLDVSYATTSYNATFQLSDNITEQEDSSDEENNDENEDDNLNTNGRGDDIPDFG